MNSFTSSFRRYGILLSVLVAFVVLSFVAASEVLVRRHVMPNDIFSAHLNMFVRSSSPNAVFGDSHAAMGFTGVPGVVNLAHVSETIAMIDGKARIYFSTRPAGQVVLQADPNMFAAYRDIDNVEGYISRFRPAENVFGWLAKQFPAMSSMHRTKLFDYWGVFLSEGRFISQYQLLGDGAIASSGSWEKIDPAKRQSEAASRVQKHLPEKIRGGVLAAKYEDMVRYLVDKGAMVCLVGFPVSEEYRQVAARYPQFAEAKAFFSDLAAKYDLLYFDFWDAISDRNAFTDQDHLTPAGAAAFAARASEKCFGAVTGNGRAR